VTPSFDVVLVGGGGAGLRAAIAIAEAAPNLRVAVVSKVYPMRSHTVSAEGGAAGVVGSDDSLDEHCYDSVSGSDWLGDQDAIEAFVKNSCDSSIGDARGAASPTAVWPSARSAA
jgi:succinate dehydrogenase flavoprotein subunit